MTGKEIKNLIDEKNEEIHNLLNPNIFILNNFVRDLMEEIGELQKQCPHHYVDGYCEYCNSREENK